MNKGHNTWLSDKMNTILPIPSNNKSIFKFLQLLPIFYSIAFVCSIKILLIQNSVISFPYLYFFVDAINHNGFLVFPPNEMTWRE